jgi:sporulation protein YlmC with PRC-barrel domain
MFGHADVAIGASSTDGSGGAPPTDSYLRERPGQDVRALIGSAKILAQLGQQQACEALLAATRDIYKDYAAALRADKVPLSDAENWRRTQISSAKPVSDANPLVNSEQLVGVEVVNPQGEDLGSVDDIVYGSQGEVIAYLVIQRGGLFGHPVADVAVPWQDFKVTSRSRILVLDSTKSNMDLAPQVKEDQFALPGGSGRQSQNVDNFWKKHLSN